MRLSSLTFLLALAALCLPAGSAVAAPTMDDIEDMGKSKILPKLLSKGLVTSPILNDPLSTRIEAEAGLRQHKFISSLTAILPLIDIAGGNHLLAQITHSNAPETMNDLGFTSQRATTGAGLIYRFLSQTGQMLFGANVFFDHAAGGDLDRGSFGFDIQGRHLGFAASYYIPLSDWSQNRFGFAERAASGWDAKLLGRTESLPSWTASLKGYEWNDQNKNNDLFGVLAKLEYAPVPALAFHIGGRDESQADASLEAGLRLRWDFDKSAAEQWSPRTSLPSLGDMARNSAHRESIIRVAR